MSNAWGMRLNKLYYCSICHLHYICYWRSLAVPKCTHLDISFLFGRRPFTKISLIYPLWKCRILVVMRHTAPYALPTSNPFHFHISGSLNIQYETSKINGFWPFFHRFHSTVFAAHTFWRFHVFIGFSFAFGNHLPEMKHTKYKVWCSLLMLWKYIYIHKICTASG